MQVPGSKCLLAPAGPVRCGCVRGGRRRTAQLGQRQRCSRGQRGQGRAPAGSRCRQGEQLLAGGMAVWRARGTSVQPASGPGRADEGACRARPGVSGGEERAVQHARCAHCQRLRARLKRLLDQWQAASSPPACCRTGRQAVRLRSPAQVELRGAMRNGGMIYVRPRRCRRDTAARSCCWSCTRRCRCRGSAPGRALQEVLQRVVVGAVAAAAFPCG